MINSPVTDIRPVRNIPTIVPTDANLRLDLDFDDLVKNCIRHVIAYVNDPLKIDDGTLPTAPLTLEQQSYHTVRTIFYVLNTNQYNLNLIKFSPNLPPTNYVNPNDNTQEAVIRYLLSCKPAKMSTMLTLLAVYKHFCFGAKDKWRKLYSSSRYRWGYNLSLFHGMSSYLHAYYVLPNLAFKQKSGIETGSRYSPAFPNIHWFWEPEEPWFVNDTKSFEDLAELIVKSGLVSIYNIYVNNSRANGFDLSSLNLCVKPEITEELLSDYLTFCLSPDHFAISCQNLNAYGLSQTLNSAVVPARASVIQKKFKRFNRIRTQSLMRIPFLLDDPSAFGSDFMTLEFEAETRPELKSVTASYRYMCGALMHSKGVKPRPQTELLYFVNDVRDYQAVVNANIRLENYVAPAVALCKVLRSCYVEAEAIAIMESHLREYR